MSGIRDLRVKSTRSELTQGEGEGGAQLRATGAVTLQGSECRTRSGLARAEAVDTAGQNGRPFPIPEALMAPALPVTETPPNSKRGAGRSSGHAAPGPGAQRAAAALGGCRAGRSPAEAERPPRPPPAPPAPPAPRVPRPRNPASPTCTHPRRRGEAPRSRAAGEAGRVRGEAGHAGRPWRSGTTRSASSRTRPRLCHSETAPLTGGHRENVQHRENAQHHEVVWQGKAGGGAGSGSGGRVGVGVGVGGSKERGGRGGTGRVPGVRSEGALPSPPRTASEVRPARAGCRPTPSGSRWP